MSKPFREPMEPRMLMEVAGLFKAIGEPTRLRLLNLLAHRGEICVCELALTLDMLQCRVSRHITALRHARLVVQRRAGNRLLCSLSPPEQPIYTCQLEALRCCFSRIEACVHDLARFDALLTSGKLMHGRPPEE